VNCVILKSELQENRFPLGLRCARPVVTVRAICVASYSITHREIFRLVHPELPGRELHCELAIKYIRVSNQF
jgi:hypothetical protein